MKIGRRRFLAGTVAGAVAGLGLSCTDGARTRGKRPNVLWIVNDASRAQNYSCYGYERETSPRLDKMAEEGTLFERAYSPAFATRPSVSAYMASRHFPIPVVLYDHMCKTLLLRTPADYVLAPTCFSAAGYRTGVITCNLGNVGPDTPLCRAFDDTLVPDKEDYQRLDKNGNPVLSSCSFKTINEAAFPWLEEHGQAPFFMHIHAMETHSPYIVPPEAPFNQWIDEDYAGKNIRRFDVVFPGDRREKVTEEDVHQLRGLYDGCVRYADHYLSELLNRLDEMGLLDNTIVVYTSDHGEWLFDDGMTHGHHTLFGGPDISHHIPLVMAGPGISKGLRVESPVQSIDILPTLLELCDIEPPGRMDGESLTASSLKRSPTRFAVTRESYRLNLNRLLVCGNSYKYEIDYQGSEEHLWTLPDSAGNRHDVSGSAQGDAAAMRSYAEKDVSALIEKAAKEEAPRAYWFSVSSKGFLAMLTKENSGLRSPAAFAKASEDSAGKWFLVREEQGGSVHLHRIDGDEGGAVCTIKFFVEYPAEYRVWMEAYADTEASEFSVRVAESDYVPVATPASGTADPGWRYIDAGVFEIKRRGYVQVQLRGTEREARLRSFLIYPDEPGFGAIAKGEFIKGAAVEEMLRRDEELEALGYL